MHKGHHHRNYHHLSLSLSLSISLYPLSIYASISLPYSLKAATALLSILKAFKRNLSIQCSPLLGSSNRLRISSSDMGSEMVMVDGVSFPPEITVAKPLILLGHGITDIEIHFLQIKYNAIGIYMEKEVVEHLGEWKGRTTNELAEDDSFFDALVSAPVEKFFRVVVIKEIKGSQYGVQLESAVRDRLAAVDKYEEEEELALEAVTEFFQSKYFKTDSVITFHFPDASLAEISFTTEGKDEAKIKVGNANVVEMIQKWFLGGSRAVSPTTVKSLSEIVGAMLSQ